MQAPAVREERVPATRMSLLKGLTMHTIKASLVALLLAAAPLASHVAVAGATDPLFVNATSDEAHKSTMALVFSKSKQEHQHAVTVFLNDRAVLLASKKDAAKFPEQQSLLEGIVKAGGTVLVCPMCMKAYGVTEADLLPGLKVASPEAVDAALFRDNTKTLSW